MGNRIMILGGSGRDCGTDTSGAAVFIHLHYRDTLDRYFAYMDGIPDGVPLYISSSDPWVEEAAGRYAEGRTGRVSVLHKENRGRDITALLVTFREEMLKYEYVCFLHDKMWKSESEKKDVGLWIDNLWGNLLGRGGRGYFHEVLGAFRGDGGLGLLVPPEPIGDISYPDNAWSELNVSLVRRLAGELGIRADIDPAITRQPVSLGTCFWARTAAVRKLLLKKWTYEDFDYEILPDDAKSYAVERIFGYLAEDAGYRARTVMDGAYASVYLDFLIEFRRGAARVMGGCRLPVALPEIRRLAGLLEYVSAHGPVYIYGAGKTGTEAYRYLAGTAHPPQGFLVTREDRDYSHVPLPVLCIDRLPYEAGTGIIVAVSGRFISEITGVLEERGIRDYYCMTC